MKKISSIVFIFILIIVSFKSNNYIKADSIEECNLKNLQIKGNEINPEFSKNITNYSIFINENIESLEIITIPEDSNCSVEIEGNNNLKTGENNIFITVKSNKKEIEKKYKIIVTKGNDFENSNSYLEDLVIDNILLSPNFQSEILEYDIGKIGNDMDTLTIVPIKKYDEQKISIIGNDNLKEGKNQIDIEVISKNFENKKTYILKYEKDKTIEKTENKLYDFDKPKNKSILKKEYIISGFIVIIIIVFFFIVIKKIKKNNTNNK